MEQTTEDKKIWIQPELVRLDIELDRVELGMAPGTDGGDPSGS